MGGVGMRATAEPMIDSAHTSSAISRRRPRRMAARPSWFLQQMFCCTLMILIVADAGSTRVCSAQRQQLAPSPRTWACGECVSAQAGWEPWRRSKGKRGPEWDAKSGGLSRAFTAPERGEPSAGTTRVLHGCDAPRRLAALQRPRRTALRGFRRSCRMCSISCCSAG